MSLGNAVPQLHWGPGHVRAAARLEDKNNTLLQQGGRLCRSQKTKRKD